MEKGILIRIFLCIGAFGLFLYSYIDEQNHLTRLRLNIPVIAKEIKDIKEENTHLNYEIELFESPEHLLELARHSEFSHLKQPLLKEIMAMPEGIALNMPAEESKGKAQLKPRLSFPIGAKQ